MGARGADTGLTVISLQVWQQQQQLRVQLLHLNPSTAEVWDVEMEINPAVRINPAVSPLLQVCCSEEKDAAG